MMTGIDNGNPPLQGIQGVVVFDVACDIDVCSRPYSSWQKRHGAASTDCDPGDHSPGITGQPYRL